MTKRFAKTSLMAAALAFILILSTSGVFAESSATEITVDYGLPVVYLNIDESGENPTIQEMNESPDHSVTCIGTFRLDAPDDFSYSDMPGMTIEDLDGLSMTIRGRGNSTWSRFPKRPYKIKFDKKTDLFGLGKNKHWVLVANYYDHSLIKDRVTAWLGEKMGFEFTPRGFPVDVVMTGSEYGSEYLGSYYLSENVRVDETRLNIDELTEDDTELPTISGGYLVQNSLQVRQGSPDRFITERGVGWATHTPSFDTEEEGHSLTGELGSGNDAEIEESNEELFNDPDPVDANDPESLGDAYENHVQQDYIQKYIQDVEDAIFAGGSGYKEKMDMESAAKYWLVNTFSINHDAYGTGSTYIYKKRNDEKLYWGPLWDFDFAWYYDETYEGFDVRHKWLEPMFYDKGEGSFAQEIVKQWELMRPYLVELAKDGGVLDGYCAETEASAYADCEIWRPGDTDFNYKDEIEEFKAWINNRINWVDENISSIENLVHRVQFVAGDEVYADEFVKDNTKITVPDEDPVKEGLIFLGWLDENGDPINLSTYVTEDLTYTADFISESEATKARDIVFKKNSDIQKRGFYVSGYDINYTVIPENAQDKRVKWTSSDEDFATVDSEGSVRYVDKGVGLKSVTITATLSNGVSRDFTLYLTDDDADLKIPESISPEKDQINMIVGTQAAFMINTQPDPAIVDDYIYASDDESIVEVDQAYGVLKAVGPGQTKVHVTTTAGGTECETYTTVMVEPFDPEFLLELPLEVSLEDEAIVKAARDKYNILTDDLRRELAPGSVERLLNAEAQILAIKAEAAQEAAEAAQKEAEQKQKEAEEAQAKAETAQKEAEQKQKEAEEAQAKAEAAQKEAEQKQKAAEEAAAAAEAAKKAAEEEAASSGAEASAKESSFRALTSNVVAASELKTSGYTKKSVIRFNETLEAAKAVLNNSKASIDEIKKADADLAAAKKALKNKKANPITVKGKKVTLKASSLKKKARSIKRKKAITVNKRRGTLTFKRVKATKGKRVYTKAFKVNSKTGKITVRKGLKKGLYKLKIKVTASGNDYYKSRSRTVTVRIKIK